MGGISYGPKGTGYGWPLLTSSEQQVTRVHIQVLEGGKEQQATCAPGGVKYDYPEPQQSILVVHVDGDRCCSILVAQSTGAS